MFWDNNIFANTKPVKGLPRLGPPKLSLTPEVGIQSKSRIHKGNVVKCLVVSRLVLIDDLDVSY
jgi:hypothetical protein